MAKRRPAHLRHQEFRRAARKDGTFDRLDVAQGGVCAICKKPPPPERTLDLDHDHATMEIRGLLCRGCNMRLRPGITADWMRRAADYLDGDWS